MFFILRALFWIGLVLLFLPAHSAPKERLAKAGWAVPDAHLLISHGAEIASSACLAEPALCRRVVATAAATATGLSPAPAAPEREAPVATGSLPPLPPPRPAAIEIAR
jgi:hypothetical protein